MLRQKKCKNGAHGFGSGVSEENFEIASRQQLEDDEARVVVEAHAYEVHDVGVVELAHDQRLHQEVHLRLTGRQFRQRLRQSEICNPELAKVCEKYSL
jgi:hypothetical protein